MHHPVYEINSSLHSISLASHVSTHLLIHLSAHHCHHHQPPLSSSIFTLSLQAQNLPFRQILPTLILLRPCTAFMIPNWTRLMMPLNLFLVRLFYLIFLFVSCGGLSWLYTSAFYCMLNTQYRIILYQALLVASHNGHNVDKSPLEDYVV